MYCRKCGKEMMEEDRYCLRCGHDQTLPGGQTQTGSIFDETSNNHDMNNYSEEKHTNYQRLIIGAVIFLAVSYVAVNIGSAIYAGIEYRRTVNEFQDMYKTVVEFFMPVEFD